MIYYTRSCAHLADTIDLPRGNVTVKPFKDGELLVKIEDAVKDKQVWVCSSTVAPADNIIETLFLVDALQRAGALIKVLFVYFGYARQDRLFPGESVSVEVVCNSLQQFNCQELHVVHIHNPEVCTFLPLHNHIPYAFFDQCIANIDLVLAPDAGAALLAERVAERHNKPYTVIKKIRPSKEQVDIIEFEDDVVGKNILIVDDMISTGSTIVKVSEVLHRQGAQRINVAATHGLFSSDAYMKIEQSVIQKVFVTNTLVQIHRSPKVIIVDVSPFVRSILI